MTMEQARSVPRTVRWRRALAIGGAALVLVVGAVALSRSSAAHKAEVAPARDVPFYDGKHIRFSAAFAERAGVKFAPSACGELAPVVRVTGSVDFDPERVAALGARVAGRIERIAKYPGDTVKAGDVVALVRSAELGRAQADILSLGAQASAAAANQRRQEALAAQRVTAEREAELARAAREQAQAELAAAQQRLAAIGGGGAGQPGGLLAITSPIDGRLVELFVARGQALEPSQTIARVADLSRLWIELAVFERDLGRIREGDRVEVAPQTDAQKSVVGHVAHVGEVIDRDTRSATVRVVVDNKDGTLRPGQSVLAGINVAKVAASDQPLVPLDAVATIDGNATLFVAVDDSAVEPRRVTLGPRDVQSVLITSGLKPGERIVVSGVFALKSELFR
jgi:membrane fusion protein, heavy metal efflux system